jgi:hypothetical protein
LDADWAQVKIEPLAPCTSTDKRRVRAFYQSPILAGDAAMSGNICRCGTYPRIRAAIHSAAAREFTE